MTPDQICPSEHPPVEPPTEAEMERAYVQYLAAHRPLDVTEEDYPLDFPRTPSVQKEDE